MTNPVRARFLATAAIVSFAACAPLPRAVAAERDARVAVFVDRGARNIGAFRWIEIVALAQGAEFAAVDGAAIRDGALDRADVLVVPGGSSVQEARSLGALGRDKVREFIKNGGGYIGTCAGLCLLMESASHHPDMLGVVPFKFAGGAGGHVDAPVYFNSRAESLAGIKKGVRHIRYAQGPVPLPSLPVDGAEIEVVASYASDINPRSKIRRSLAGEAAAVAGTYGKGRIFALAVHPEYDADDHDILAAAFKFVCGREVKWKHPQRKRGTRTAALVCDDSFGAKSANRIVRLLKDGEYDIVPVNKQAVEAGALDNVDEVIVPETVESVSLEKIYGKERLEAWKRGSKTPDAQVAP